VVSNKPGYELFNYDVYALCGDGDMMEGISGELPPWPAISSSPISAGSMTTTASPLRATPPWLSPRNVATRFIGYGWNVTRVGDANDLDMLTRAFECFKRCEDRPTLIIVDSHIAYGAPHKQDTGGCPRGASGRRRDPPTKRNYGWPEDAKFLVPDEVRENSAMELGQRGKGLRTAWKRSWNGIRRSIRYWPTIYCECNAANCPPAGTKYSHFPADPKGLAGRESSARC